MKSVKAECKKRVGNFKLLKLLSNSTQARYDEKQRKCTGVIVFRQRTDLDAQICLYIL